jgi:hypothetical protein
VSFTFQKAKKYDSKLRMALGGPSGSGKTYTAISIACALGKKVAVLDTEHGSARLYSDRFDFDVVEMEAPYSVERYIEAMNVAASAGYDVLVIDSLSHAWAGPGGVLDYVDTVASQSQSSNTYAAWRKGTPKQLALVEAINSFPLHLIATMREKVDYAIEKDEKTNKTTVRKLGLAPIQREGLEYEFTCWCELRLPDNEFLVTKTRLFGLAGLVIVKPKGTDIAAIIKKELSGEKAPDKVVIVGNPAPGSVTFAVVPHWADDPAKLGKLLTELEKKAIGIKDVLEMLGLNRVQDFSGTGKEFYEKALGVPVWQHDKELGFPMNDEDMKPKQNDDPADIPGDEI